MNTNVSGEAITLKSFTARNLRFIQFELCLIITHSEIILSGLSLNVI